MSIDPKLQYCSCGYCWTPGLYEKIVMLIRGEYVKKCPRCQTRLHCKLYNFVVIKERDRIDKKELWRKG